jgi:hypothetical protein
MQVSIPLFNSVRPLLLILFWGLALAEKPLAAAESAIHPFKTGSLEQIKAAHTGQPFLLLLWSLECASCIKEMSDIAKAKAQHPEMAVVMVSTDEESSRGEAQETLAKHGLQKLEQWIFAEPNAQRLRYEIDPQWFGELPRSYFYDASHQRLPVSGAINNELIETWRTGVQTGRN